ncbi:MAG: zinc ribbon domain-containing protein [Chloroflexi bacterium]|nr:zinc ribbon domain-containing protein [Chloroflexota bacterium]
MPIYTYRREDGTTFDFRQKFTDDALDVDPETGQHVTRVIQPAGVIFKGSGFYVNDSKSASHSAIGTPKSEKTEASADKTDKTDKSEKAEKSDKAEKTETTASKPAASTESAPKAAASAAAD